MLASVINEKCNCVTGSIWAFTPIAKSLHSWVEMEHDGKIWCIDNNYNLVMEKADYYYLFHPKVIESISDKKLEEDYEMIDFR